MKLFEKLFGKKEVGSPCWVLAKEANVIEIVSGIIGTNLGGGIEISYKWLDNTMHSFLDGQDNYIGIRGITGRPMYRHDVGELFGQRLTEQMIDAFNEHLVARGEEELPCIGSEYYQSISESDIGSKMIQTLESFEEGGGVPWRWVLIVGGVLILGIVLWQTGILQSLFGSVQESVVPGVNS